MQRTFTKLAFTFMVIMMTNPLAISQTSFSDNFDSYNAGDWLCVVNPKWKTWDNKPGTATDMKISAEKSVSGNNSLKVFAANANGGPSDVILPFGGRYDKGLFILEWKMYVEKGKNGYFNIQGNETPGVLWALNGYFRDNNRLDLTASNNSPLFSTTFPNDQWFTFALEINLSSNNWKVIINGECQGAFKNTTKFIASMNLYPTDINCVYFVDDISYSYDPQAPEIMNDAAIDNVTWNDIRFTGTENNFSFRVSNIGTENLLSLELDATHNGNPIDLDLSGVELLSGESQVITSSSKIALLPGTNTIELQVSKVNGLDSDEEECNNNASLVIEGVTPAQNKAVLVEEATGTWCPWCPRGAVFLDLMSKRYKNTYIGVAVHNNDPMAVQAYDALIRSTPGFTGFPSVVLNRTNVTDPSTSEQPFLDRISVPAPAYFVTSACFDETTRKLDVSVTTIFQENTTKPFWVNLVLTEDGVRGTGSGYNQANAYAGGGAGPMGGYELLPNPVPAAQMVYDHVGRFITGVQKGADNSLDDNYSVGQEVTRYFSFTIPASMNINKFHIVPILLNGDGFQNAAITSFEDAVVNCTVSSENTIVSEGFRAYPNPATDEVFVDFTIRQTSDITIELTDVTGRVVASKTMNQLQGEYTIPVQTATWTAGMYMIHVRTKDELISKKIFVTK